LLYGLVCDHSGSIYANPVESALTVSLRSQSAGFLSIGY